MNFLTILFEEATTELSFFEEAIAFVTGDEFNAIITIASILIGALVTGIPMVISIVNAIKAKKEAKTEAEKAEANNTLTAKAQEFITLAESTYKSLDTFMKARNEGSAGAIKKDTVLTKLQNFASQIGVTFDTEYWSAKIDELVELTKKVNSK